MSRRKYKKKNYKYPKENDADDNFKNDIINCKSIDELIEETKDIDNDNKNKKYKQDNKLKSEKDNTKEITNKENLSFNHIENESIEGDLLNYLLFK